MTNPPNTKDFAAWINLMPGSDPKLIVVGKVETSADNMHPKLTRTVPQGANPTIFLLDLTIEQVGVGSEVIGYRETRHEEHASKGQYFHVAIMWEGTQILQLNVSEAH
ncbi:hypothetical protein [Ruegeria hyattellae]|uniref:hypothetical protein n=1 Tax=Ruegeria hyattellae TaxID=3233337 RepID=UPI00355C1B08